jgi:hypothetical protein
MFEVLMFVEDDAQETFLKRLVERLACEAGVMLTLRVRIAQGGPGRGHSAIARWRRVR